MSEKIFSVLWRTQPTHLLLLLEEAYFPCFTIYVHYISVERFQVRFLGDKQLRKAIVLVCGYGLRPQVVLVPPPPAPPPHTGEAARAAGSGGGWGRVFFKGGGGGRFFYWVESNGLAGTRVSGGCRNWDPRSLHWPGCLSGPPRTACGAGGRSNRDRGSSCSAVSSSCGGWDPLPLGVSGIAAGSERGTHLSGEGGVQSNTPTTHVESNDLHPLVKSETNLFPARRLCCYCCWRPLPSLSWYSVVTVLVSSQTRQDR